MDTHTITHVCDQMVDFDKMRDVFNMAAEREDAPFGTRIVAVLYHRNKIIAKGINKEKSHPFQARFAKNEHAIFIHAEIDAIKNAIDAGYQDLLPKCHMIVARAKTNINPAFTSEGKLGIRNVMVPGIAKPCEGCQSAIALYGIPEVYHTCDDSNDIGVL